MASSAPVQIDRQLIAELTDKEEKRLEDATPKSFELYQRAVKLMPMGVASTYHARDPYPVYFTHGKGSHDLHGRRPGDPRLPQRLRLHGAGSRATRSSSRPSRSAPRWARSSACPPKTASSWPSTSPDAFKLPKWRFVNSGSEATMDAIRVARGFTGREPIVKMFGSYHGHHDYVMVSIGVKDFGHDRSARQLQVDLVRRRHSAVVHRPHHPGAPSTTPRTWSSASSARSPRAARRPPSSWSPP